jgi:hypothetical protein
MKYLKMTFVRIVLSLFCANMINELIVINTNREYAPAFAIILLTALFYFGLTLYVNNRR